MQTLGGKHRPFLGWALALAVTSVVGCGAAPSLEASSQEPDPVMVDSVCPLPRMDERRFSLHGGPTTCELHEERCNRECMRGDARHCYLLGSGYLQTQVRRGRVLRGPNPELAAELLLRGCELGLPESCSRWVLATGRAVDVEVCQRPVVERACELDVAEGCFAGAVFANEAGRRERARELGQRACDLGDYDMCAALADTIDLTAPGGHEALRRLLFAACFRGEHLRSCVRLAEALEDGPFATDAANEARIAWQQACRLDQSYCARIPPPAPASTGTDVGSGTLHPDAPGASEAGPPRTTLSAQTIRMVIRGNIYQVEACYEAALQRQPQLRGTVTVRFLIQDDGHVSEATVISTTAPDGDLDACITGAVRTFRFTPPDGGGQVSVTYPFTLDSD